MTSDEPAHLPRSQRHDAALAGGRRGDAPVPSRAVRKSVEQSRLRPAGARGGASARASRSPRSSAATTDEVFFTSGGTEANNLAIRGVAEAAARGGTSSPRPSSTPRPRTRVAISSSHGVARDSRPRRCQRSRPARRRSAIALADDTALVTVMHANNETGTLQPIADDRRARARARRAHAHGRGAERRQDAGATSTSSASIFSPSPGHKLNAPKGVGALYVRRGTPIAPFLLGAGHERGLRPGTENVASIVGLGVACRHRPPRPRGAKPRTSRELRDRLWSAPRGDPRRRSSTASRPSACRTR